jgi:hypothetical protein
LTGRKEELSVWARNRNCKCGQKTETTSLDRKEDLLVSTGSMK